jgi:predicted transcriptional regulator
MFKLIGTATLTDSSVQVTSDFLLSQTKVTRKQFYSNMSKLVNKTGLISRKHGRYALSNYGKVVFYSINILIKGAKHFWALKALDNDELSNDIPPEQILEISARLIEDRDILKIVSDLY